MTKKFTVRLTHTKTYQFCVQADSPAEAIEWAEEHPEEGDLFDEGNYDAEVELND